MPDHEVSPTGQFHFDPATYLDEIVADVPRYDELQAATIDAIPFPPSGFSSSGSGPP